MHYWDLKSLRFGGVGGIEGHGRGGVIQTLFVSEFWHFSGLANYAKVPLQDNADNKVDI